MRLLIVTAVAAEAAAAATAFEQVDPDPASDLDAVGARYRCRHAEHEALVLASGVGPAASAAVTAAALADPVDLVLNAGIGGGFAPHGPGDLVVSTSSVFADLGVGAADRFLPLSELGLGDERIPVRAGVAEQLAARTGGALGTVLTVATATGTDARRDQLLAAHPDAAAEGMEGAGVACAARLFGVQFAELRAISNAVGERDRDAWDIPGAFDRLTRAIASIIASPWEHA